MGQFTQQTLFIGIDARFYPQMIQKPENAKNAENQTGRAGGREQPEATGYGEPS